MAPGPGAPRIQSCFGSRTRRGGLFTPPRAYAAAVQPSPGDFRHRSLFCTRANMSLQRERARSIERQGGTTTKLNPRHYSDALLHLPAAAAVAVAPPRRIVGPWAPPRRPHPMHVPTLDNRFPDFQSLASGTWLFLPFWSIRHHASSDPLLRSSVQLDLLIYRHSPYHLDRTESYSSSVVY